MNSLAKLQKAVKHLCHELKPTPLAFSGAADGITALGLVVVFLYFYFAGVADFAIEKIPALIVWLLLPIGLGCSLLFAASLVMGLPLRLRLVLAFVAPIMLLSVFPGSDLTSILSGSLVVVCFGLIGAGSGVMLQTVQPAKGRIAAIGYLLVGVLGLGFALYSVFSEKSIANPALVNYQLEDKTLDLPNPGLAGDYAVKTLTYGSGQDLHRDEYASEVTVLSRSVDGSKLIDNWDGLSGWLRTNYWGFDVTNLPLQARVWMPEGDGPFPLVLVVHGNHGMEDFSDPGYDYLGELLASRGIILASVDENFTNSSYSARINVFADRPGLKEENDARGWLLLEHLAQFRDWNGEAGHYFFNKIDMQRLALIGHSRGGEAVGIAAAFNTLDYYPDDASQEFDFDFNISGVIAIAPVYGQYEPRSRPTPVTDVNYFTIHGDMDGDVQSFEGAAQYSRVGFTGDEYKFRSSLYVVGANHGQFNTTWENLDIGRFNAWSLDLGRIMPRLAQRTVAKVYFSAFLEAVFNNKTEYLPLFKDARFGSTWLPNTFYINQFSDSQERVIVDFENDLDLTTLDKTRGSVATESMTRWYEVANSLKYDKLDSHSVVLAWDKSVTGDASQPSATFSLGNTFAGVGPQSLVLSLSAIDVSTKPTGWEEDSEVMANEEEPAIEKNELLDWTIELTDSAGNVALAPLSTDSALYPLVNAIPRRAKFLDDTDPTEILFRRFELPFERFKSATADFNYDWISEVRFLFDRSPKGAIILDSISLSAR